VLQRSTTTTIVVFCLAGIFGAAWLVGDRRDHDQTRNNSSGKNMDEPPRAYMVFQDRENNCGAATLKMILEHFGRTVPLRDLERKLALSSRGASLQRLKEIADEVGLHACGWKLRQEDLARIRYPIIMFLKKNHFVVADSLSASGLLAVRDPAMGEMRIPQDELPDIWDGEALVFSCEQVASISTKKLDEQE
jgi:ABC-type bacteriocin/lantibiotic exporter with double-glycine peptidase domain